MYQFEFKNVPLPKDNEVMCVTYKTDLVYTKSEIYAMCDAIKRHIASMSDKKPNMIFIPENFDISVYDKHEMIVRLKSLIDQLQSSDVAQKHDENL